MLILLVILGAGLGHVQTEARTQGRVDLVTNILQGFINPVAIPVARGFIAFDDFASGVFHASSLVIENDRLRSQMVALDAYDDRINFLKEQNDQLRRELSLPDLNRQRVNLDVIGISQLDQTLILDGGSELGIHADLPVVNGDGLVGIIRSVSRGESRASFITSYGVKVGGVDSSRTPPQAGLVNGTGASTLTMLTFEPKSPVASGDLIITGGQSKNIPATLPIGRVINVVDDQFYGTRRLTILPSVNLGLLHEVQVLK